MGVHQLEPGTTWKSASDSSRCRRQGRRASGMSGAAMALRNAARGIGSPMARAAASSSKATQVPTLCATICRQKA